VTVLAGVTDLILAEPTGAVELGSRYPKRTARIIEKMVQHDAGMERLHDIAGIRVIIEGGLEAQHAFVTRLALSFDKTTVKDHVAKPRATGYRAVHVIAFAPLPVEIQVRTERQHYWAEAVEEVESRLRFPLKDGNGPRDLLDYFRTASELTALEEGMLPADEHLVGELDALRERVRHYFRRTGT
jgi:ppGpp synthetase/RelA/SpoT-type nucleotidyltranferase